jgi:regulatory protein
VSLRRATRRSSRSDRADDHTDDRGTGPPADPESVARTICLRLLTQGPRTRAQLADALSRRGVPDEAAGRVLVRLGEVGLIDDATFARSWVSSRHHGRGLAGRALTAELRHRGVDAETTAEAVGELDPDTEEQTARALVRRRLAGSGDARLDPVTRQRRLLGLLARKGYPAGLAYRVIREELAARGSQIDDLAGRGDLDAAEAVDLALGDGP